MIQPFYKVATTIDLSAANSTTFEGTAPFPNISFQYVWSSVVGAASSFKLQSSNDNSNFDDMTGYTGTTSGGSGSGSWQITGYSFLFYRVLVTSASTSGNLIVTASGNGA